MTAEWFRPRLSVLPARQRTLWPRFAEMPARFVLYGGTGLALRLGHRPSEDFDFFSSDELDAVSIERAMPWIAAERLVDEASNTAEFDVGGVKVSFFGGASFGRAGVPQRAGKRGPLVASLIDLAAKKLKVIAQRAEVKDDLDVFSLLKAGVSLEAGLGAARAVYGPRFNPLPTLKALGYFEDGDLPTLPARVKRTLTDAAGRVGSIDTIPLASRRLD